MTSILLAIARLSTSRHTLSAQPFSSKYGGCEIPYGETRTYQDIALSLNNPQGARAVAQAIGANGISIIIPCHRVIGSDHSLTGFAGGLDAKRQLLETERRS